MATDRPAGSSELYYGGIDAGGTKFLCAIGRGPADIVKIAEFETTSQSRTLAAVADFFNQWLSDGNPLAGLGVSSFGPLVRDPEAPDYGKLGNTPKRGWTRADIGGFLRRSLRVPIGIDTDVNGAALAEARWGAARGDRHFAYMTVGTGIGIGLVANGQLVNGLAHPELGHYRPPRHPEDEFSGLCPFHGDCLEGLASGPALAARVQGAALENLPDDAAVWRIAAHYLAHLCTIILLACAPERIILGGGVMRRASLFQQIRRMTQDMLGGYLQHPLHASGLETIIVPSGLIINRGEAIAANAGVLGGFILAEGAVQREKAAARAAASGALR